MKLANVGNVTEERITERASGCERLRLRNNIPEWRRKKVKGMSTVNDDGMVGARRNYGTREPSRASSPEVS